MSEFTQEPLNAHDSTAANSETPAPLPAREWLIDGSAPATEDDIRKLRQVENFFRERRCLPKNYRPLSGDAHARHKQRQQQQTDDDWSRALLSEFITIPPGAFIGPLPESPEIMDRLTSFMCRYLVCTPDQLAILALWIMHTYCYKAFFVTPYLSIHSMERRSGKTTCLQLLRYLCPDSWSVTAPAAVIVIRKLLHSH